MKPADRLPRGLPSILLVGMLAGPGVAVADPVTPAAAGAARADAAPAPAPNGYPKLTPAELARVAASPNVLVLDVRAPEEFAKGAVPGAINVPHEQVEARLAELEAHRGKQVVVYCRTGRRAGLALDVLTRHGFRDVRHLDGDMPGWTAAGKPVASPAATSAR